MKHISKVQIGGNDGGDGGGDKRKTWAFVSSVMSLYYPGTDLKRLEGIQATCLQYHQVINEMTDNDFHNRLNMIRKISAVPNMPNLWGNYRSAQGALRMATGDINALVHDYHVVEPKSGSTGELKRIQEHQKTITEHDNQVGQSVLKSLKDLF